MTDATLSTVNGQPTLRFERRLAHRPAKVWRAVTEPAELKHWFPAAVETELRPGAPMRFVFGDEAPVDGDWDGEVLEVDEPKVFMFRWARDVLRFELIPDGDGCRLVFTQTIGGGDVGMLGAGRTAAGWDTCLDQLVSQVDGGPATPTEDWAPPIDYYVEKFGIADGTVESTSDGWRLRFARDLVWRAPADVWPKLVELASHHDIPAGRELTVAEPRVLEYEWLHDGEPAGTVRWELHSDPELGERVELTQTVPARLADLRARLLATWHGRVAHLFAAALGESAPQDRTAELTKHYAEQLD
jgi:uncharacterized protein YndB with AHSA1/START domain